MRKLSGLLAVLVLLLHGGVAFAQTSDYEIIQSYKSRHQSLLESIRTAQDPGQLGTLESDVNSLETESAQHQKLLGDGLHPDTFAGSIGALRDQLKKTTERLALVEESRKDKATIETITLKAEADGKTIAVITRQNEEFRVEIEKLTQEVANLSAQIQQLATENAGLLEKIRALQAENKKDKASIARLKELTEKLNANIRNRNDLIVKMMDSLFNEYSKSDLTDAQKNNLLVNAQGNDYVGKIIATVDGNVRSVERTVMLPQDVGLIKDEERKVTAKWNAIKPYVGKLYPTSRPGPWNSPGSTAASPTGSGASTTRPGRAFTRSSRTRKSTSGCSTPPTSSTRACWRISTSRSANPRAPPTGRSRTRSGTPRSRTSGSPSSRPTNSPRSSAARSRSGSPSGAARSPRCSGGGCSSGSSARR